MNINLANVSLSKLWEELCNLVIRPMRAQYEPSVSLGPKLFALGNRVFERKDFTVTNSRSLKLQCSMYQPIDPQRPTKKLPCVIYCHGNCGSRVDALDAVQTLLQYNICVLAFDFSGSGLSEGDFVSLGFYEKQDVAAIVEHLRKMGTVSRIGLWGRSMGAATSIMYSRLDSSISGIVVDSPFTSLEDIMTELVLSYQSWIPKRVIRLGTNMMRSSIQTRAGFDIKQNCPIDYAKKCFVPVLFAHAESDDFIRIHHSEKLFEAYAGDKTIIRFEGDHNSERPDFFFDAVATFFYNTLISNDPNLDGKTVPSGSVSHRHGIGKRTEKGQEMADLDSDDEPDADAVQPASLVNSYMPSPPSNEELGVLPPSPAQPQVHIPHAFVEAIPHSNNEEQQELQVAICLSTIEDVKRKLATRADEKERERLQKELEELKQQAKELGANVE